MRQFVLWIVFALVALSALGCSDSEGAPSVAEGAPDEALVLEGGESGIIPAAPEVVSLLSSFGDSWSGVSSATG